jgi:hypothetical protein
MSLYASPIKSWFNAKNFIHFNFRQYFVILIKVITTSLLQIYFPNNMINVVSIYSSVDNETNFRLIIDYGYVAIYGLHHDFLFD